MTKKINHEKISIASKIFLKNSHLLSNFAKSANQLTRLNPLNQHDSVITNMMREEQLTCKIYTHLTNECDRHLTLKMYKNNEPYTAYHMHILFYVYHSMTISNVGANDLIERFLYALKSRKS